ncbi:MerR family DNA-binding transcriptional regulator [Deinococcus ruber]|uniref:HTH merR-type domain-containing protein n=1 Tax=Deinococcus ruber TaxID=1848197 RepID=A0A918FBU8_9DEIO|nr:MerR family DNA-binding transcriptional regulator [Deinococcus ruber]GGR19950.1 hypothetical protein GCM10008957_35430 [Deinococcus ruber]
MKDMSKIRIGELAEQAGVNTETIRYYERLHHDFRVIRRCLGGQSAVGDVIGQAGHGQN